MTEEREELRPCPACPDGNVWGSEGPTGRICPVCGGFAEVKMDGSLCDAARERSRYVRRPGLSYRRGEDE